MYDRGYIFPFFLIVKLSKWTMNHIEGLTTKARLLSHFKIIDGKLYHNLQVAQHYSMQVRLKTML